MKITQNKERDSGNVGRCTKSRSKKNYSHKRIPWEEEERML